MSPSFILSSRETKIKHDSDFDDFSDEESFDGSEIKDG